jgi:hypothetical protein
MAANCGLKLIGSLLVTALAFGQSNQAIPTLPATGQPTTASQQSPTSGQPTGQPPTTTTPAKRRPSAPPSIADAARTSKQLQDSEPPAKVYRNNDVRDRTIPASTATGDHSPVAVPAAVHPAPAQIPPSGVLMQTPAAFEAQGMMLKNQVRVQKGKIIDIQNHINSLKYQFDQWTAEYSQNNGALVCGTSLYSSPDNKEWCDTGRNLKAQYDSSQTQLDQEKARLEQMQDGIRRKGYGSSVYDPD